MLHFRSLKLSALLAGMIFVSGSMSVIPATAAEAVEVAQADIGMFVDRRGRRVYYDRRTDRIVAIEEPDGRRALFPGDRQPAAALGEIDPDYFPPPPPPAEEIAPVPRRVERAPLQAPSEPGGRRFRSLEELLEDRGVATSPEPDPVPAPAPQAEPLPETRTAAIPRTDPLPKVDADIVAKLQVLLDRKGVSPGVIDGRMGSNVQKALDSYRTITGRVVDPANEIEIDAELELSGGDAFTDYTITPEDVAGPFIPSVPEDYAEKAKLEALSFTSPLELLAEKFHMDQDYLVKLNPGADFNQPGTTIRVAATGEELAGTVVRIEADKTREQVRAYDETGALIAAYPATIGSSATPSPSGTHTVERIAVNPNYTYNPKINFVQGDNRDILTIAPGPNGPVGSIWIALSKPTYGIHGTPEPSRIGKTNSNGCVRLTNWDAAELADMVSQGVTVEFLD
ncbi:L,D-transpeptidase [Oricola cellulosilytica]|uniref:L,D-transpeptidase n=1 Tax=Oricola cellulosilytica TaxID=1429082 RepID=A0A4R0PEA4_9HYPH|nr:L,D-transpeptidase [Oricola cellulosilytica]TCD13703.1 L,D-transpeptidase [Oricola cellulosilytica]